MVSLGRMQCSKCGAFFGSFIDVENANGVCADCEKKAEQIHIEHLKEMTIEERVERLEKLAFNANKHILFDDTKPIG